MKRRIVINNYNKDKFIFQEGSKFITEGGKEIQLEVYTEDGENFDLAIEKDRRQDMILMTTYTVKEQTYP